MKNFEVSLFAGYSGGTMSRQVNIDTVLFPQEYRTQIMKIRSTESEIDRRNLKSKLPCYTPSGIFSGRHDHDLIQHSGLICIDLDRKDNPHVINWDGVKQQISSIEGLFYAGLSVSGDGLFVLIQIENPKFHLEHFFALQTEFKRLGLNIDQSCKNLARLRCISYDDNPIYTPTPSVHKNRAKTAYKRPATPLINNDGSETMKKVLQCLKEVEAYEVDMTDRYQDWYALGRSLAAEFGEGGRSLFHRFSQFSRKYKPKECDRQYGYCLRTCDRTTIATFFGICKRYL